MESSSFIRIFRIDYDEFNRPVDPDEIDHNNVTKKLILFNRSPDPRVGDYVIVPDGTYERFSYFHEGIGLQTTTGGSFFLGDGAASYSGGLKSVISLKNLERTRERKPGIFWAFHHNDMRAHNGIGIEAVCRVYKVI